MKLIYNSNFNSHFPKLSGNLGLWLLLMGISMNVYGQFHVSDNTTISITEGTVLYVDEVSVETSTNIDKENVKIYVGQNTKLINFPIDANVEIAYLEKETKPKKVITTVQQKQKTKLPEQPIAIEDSETEKRTVLSFTSQHKVPSALFYSVKSTKAAFINSSSFAVKSFPLKKSSSNTIYTFLLNDSNQQIKTSLVGALIKSQIHLARQITRPPPILIKSLADFA